ncbi:MAG: MFS transporter [Phycisphaerales bacterium]|nr:MFS transporter [Phycisphaerales bacterium]
MSATPSENAGPSRALPGAGRALALLLAINLFNYIDRYILAAVVTPMQADLFRTAAEKQDADTKTGWLQTAFLVSYMLIAPLFGWLGDRWRRWAIVGIGVVLWSLASGGSGLAASFAMLLLTRMMVGVGEAAYGPIAPTLLADMYPIDRRARILSFFYLAIPVGSAMGFMIGGWLNTIGGWRLPFYAVVAPGLLLGLLCFLQREPARTAAASRKPRWSDYMTMARTPSFVLCTIGYTISTFAIGGVSFWMPKYVSEYRRAGTLDEVNTWFGLITVVAGLSATMAGGWLGDWLRPRVRGAYFIVSGAGMLVAFPLFLGVLYTPFPYAWAMMFLAVFFMFLNIGPVNTIPANVIHPSIRASAYAITILVIHLFGDAISPLIIGAISDATKTPALPLGNMNLAFQSVSGAILISGIVWLLGAGHLERDTERAATRLPPG